LFIINKNKERIMYNDEKEDAEEKPKKISWSKEFKDINPQKRINEAYALILKMEHDKMKGRS
tara:strand:+ start:89 stop:274 length:186 start_codon:yes stop_codon:yes gene_type:complete